MKKIFVLLFCLLVKYSVGQLFSFKEWENEKVVDIKKEPARLANMFQGISGVY